MNQSKGSLTAQSPTQIHIIIIITIPIGIDKKLRHQNVDKNCSDTVIHMVEGGQEWQWNNASLQSDDWIFFGTFS